MDIESLGIRSFRLFAISCCFGSLRYKCCSFTWCGQSRHQLSSCNHPHEALHWPSPGSLRFSNQCPGAEKALLVVSHVSFWRTNHLHFDVPRMDGHTEAKCFRSRPSHRCPGRMAALGEPPRCNLREPVERVRRGISCCLWRRAILVKATSKCASAVDFSLSIHCRHLFRVRSSRCRQLGSSRLHLRVFS